jgi:CRISPR-associated protein Cmr6
MSIAAVPNYLQSQNPEFYLSAPPGHRFLLYFAAWGENQQNGTVDWRMKDRIQKMCRQNGQIVPTVPPQWEDLPNDQFACTIAAGITPPHDPLKPRTRVPQADTGLKPWRPMMEFLLGRQAAMVATVPEAARLSLPALATSPFTTGLGNEHPLENGFAFLNPYGLPYLPGSGVKGVLRQAARELGRGDWGDSPWRASNHSLSGVEANAPDFDSAQSASYIDALFGREDSNEALRGALSFWDVIPQIKGDSLMVEIMTPHQSHYYQQNPAAGSISPHDSGQPIPISYLTVPPGSGFTFHVVCDLAHLERIAPKLARDGRWKSLVTAAFEHAFAWCGFGAKTAVGYGAMARDVETEAREAEEQAKAETQARLDALPPNLQQVEKFRTDMAQRFAQLNGKLDRQNTEYHQKAQKLARDARESDGWTLEEKRAAADAITEWLPKVVERIDKDALKKLKLAALRGEG